MTHVHGIRGVLAHCTVHVFACVCLCVRACVYVCLCAPHNALWSGA